MYNNTVSTYYVALQPPYKIIKHGNMIGVQIGTQRVVTAGGNPFRTETHDYPVVAAENRIAALKDNDYHLDGSCDGEVWDNVETKNVSVLCDVGVCLRWQLFVKILWHDHARLNDPRQPINKVFIYNKIVSYNVNVVLPQFGHYILHLHTETSAEGTPNVVRTADDDVFALNVEWSDNLVELENRLVSDLIEYLLILSPNRSANSWHMQYETVEDKLRPLVDRLNANNRATRFRKTIMASFTVTALPPYEEKNTHSEPQETNMEESVLDKIPANNLCYYYEGWRNGKRGGFVQERGIYRFREMLRNKGGILDNVHNKEEDNPIVAVGIVAYWLMFNSKKEIVLKRLTQYKNGIPQDIRELFEKYTIAQFGQFKELHRDDPNAWDWDWDKEFYTNYIIPHEIALNKQSEALFDYISDSDIALVRAVMNNYIRYLKKIRTEKGYQVNPELLVLRAIASEDETKQEDLEEFEVNTILDKLEEKGYIQVAWIEGHKPEGVRLLDKGRYYLKQLEEGNIVNETEPIVTPQQPPRDNSGDIPPQTPRMSQTPKASGHKQILEEEEWDNKYDYIFDQRVKPKAIMKALAGIVRPKKISDVRFYYVSCRIFEILHYLTENALRTDFMRWINLHFKCGWPDDKKHKRRFSFSLEDSSKNLETQHPSQWDENTIKGGSGIYHHQLAIKLKNTFTQTIINGEAIDDSKSFEHLIDRGQYLQFATHLRDNEYYIPEEAYINNGK